ncbi:N-6 DNA methylase [Flavobacterium tructae]|uniref:N-6 DNA methylase n=1 Tax=Flavobacterium tructae TaxID=1114873 RepID=UPI0035A84177
MQFKSFVKKLGFLPKENTTGIFIKNYSNCNDYCIEIDFENEKFNYGKLISYNSKTTLNFSQAENWVVLECLNRLLEKGYAPKDITLEKVFPSGHGHSGRLDIFVEKEGKAFLMIECKTYGKEFEKELSNVYKNGGQLFTYFQNDKNAQILMLYSSELNKKGVIQYKNEIINIEEEYRETANVKDFYDRWNKLPKSNGVFDEWVLPYGFESKALTPKDLNDIEQKDSSFIFNQFLKILRHNVVSDKPNAFNKIFTLFLCKIYDEKFTKPNSELAFQWFYTSFTYEGITYPKDDHVSFQKRLTDLYRKGMNAFLDKQVTDISDAEFEKKYGNEISEVTKKAILNEIVEIRLKKNNEFAIKEVFNDDSFEENAIVVKEVVELLQGFKIRYTKKQQYLSDFFELLLTTGLKQESGQFFTPVPIAQYIIKSIPFDVIVNDKLNSGKAEEENLLPTIIDYASGSGHFITESMHEMQRIIDKAIPENYIESTARKLRTWKDDHFEWAYKYVYGIEKDYRLVKVGKVGCYLHGDGLAQIVHSDGLGNFTKTNEYKGLLNKVDRDFPQENKQFDIVISNPPYSVSSFKNNARKYYSELDFELYNSLSEQSSEIECLFIERTKQLLKDGGIAGIILPDSILDNESDINIKARQIIFQHFDIIGITEFGTNVFMATKIKTKVLFLRRRNNYLSINLRDSVDKFFTHLQDVTLNGIENAVTKYIEQVWDGINFTDYISLINNNPNDTIINHENFTEYTKNLKLKEQKDKIQKIIQTENEKLFYFVLTYNQRIVYIKTGEKDKEKQFLGYEFSERKNKEGIHPIKGDSIEECTKLFDDQIFDNPEKASTYVYNAFLGKLDLNIHDNLKDNIEYSNLVDLLNFKTVNFNLKVGKTDAININYEEIWQTTNLQYLFIVAETKKGTSITKSKTVLGEIPVVAGGQNPAYYHNESNRDGNIITVSASGAYAGYINYFENPIFASDCNTINSKNENVIPNKLLFHLLKIIQPQFYQLQRGQAQPHVYKDDIDKVKIPILTEGLSKKILEEIEELELRSRTVVINDIENQKGIILKKYLM